MIARKQHFPIHICGFITLILQRWSLAQVNADNHLLQAITRTKDMIITSSNDATLAGEAVLRSGGTAVDAMIAAQTVLGLVRPQDSGIGGGAFAVYYDASTGTTTAFDGRETAPAAANEDRFLGMDFVNAWQSGLSVGVPGVPRLMQVMHEKYGKSSWADLFQCAIDLAENGFEFHPSVSIYLEMMYGMFGFECSGGGALLFRDDTAKDYFVYPNCTAPSPGTTMYNLEYADTLRSLVSGGADAFYSGDIAYDIVDAVVNDRNIPGDMSLDDLKNYHIIERPVVCENFRGHRVCGMGPPSSGGIGVGQILGMLDELNKTDKDAGPLGLDNIHLFTQAMRLAFADRNQYVADSDFVEVPVQGMLNDEYLISRANLINADGDMGFVLAGNPPGSNASKSSFLTDKENGTAHISIIDQYGNAISMTTTIESPFGNSVMVRGFLLNNELTDFSFEPIDESNNKTFANRVEPNKRPRSSMAPTIVFDETGNVEIVTGSAGGSKIIGDVAQTIMNIIDFDMDPQEAANIPHYQNRNEITEIESSQSGLSHTFGLVEYDAEQVAADLKAMGHSDPALPLEDRVVSIVPMWISKLTTIQLVRDHDGSKVFVGGVDPRSDGAIGGSNEFDRSFPDTFTPLDQANVDTSKAASDTNSVSTSCLALVFVLLCFCA